MTSVINVFDFYIRFNRYMPSPVMCKSKRECRSIIACFTSAFKITGFTFTCAKINYDP